MISQTPDEQNEEVFSSTMSSFSSFSSKDRDAGLQVDEYVEEENDRGEVKEYCVVVEEEEHCSSMAEVLELETLFPGQPRAR